MYRISTILIAIACAFFASKIQAQINPKRTPSGHIQAYQIYDANGKKLSYTQFIERLGNNLEKHNTQPNVLLFGELHDNPIVHWMQIQTTQDLWLELNEDTNKITKANLGPLMVLGAEMFETDQQSAVNEYLNPSDTSHETQTQVSPMGATMGEDPNFATLKKSTKLWPNFKTDYKPLLDFSRDNHIPFIATNIPRKFASLVYKVGIQALDTLSADKKMLFPTMPMPYDSTLNCYAEIFKATGGHGGQNLPMSQAIKDATMAWKIYGNLPRAGGVFIHYNGSYHSDKHQSIEWYLRQEESTVIRSSMAKNLDAFRSNIITISSRTQMDVTHLEPENKGIADFTIVIPDNMTRTY